MADSSFPEQPSHKEKMRAIEIAEVVANTIENDKAKVGSLLCEGLENSIDVAIYSAVYPYFVVIPANGCTDVIKLLPRLRKFSEYPAFAIIDRDNRSKRNRQRLEQQGIYTTRLPFIENIICCPEVLKIIARIESLDYQEVIQKVRSSFISILVEKLSYLNPFYADLPNDTDIKSVRILISSKERTIHKDIDLSNVLYTFRDKMIVSEVANAIGYKSKEWYYNYVATQVVGPYSEKLVSAMARYLPRIKVAEV